MIASRSPARRAPQRCLVALDALAANRRFHRRRCVVGVQLVQLGFLRGGASTGESDHGSHWRPPGGGRPAARRDAALRTNPGDATCGAPCPAQDPGYRTCPLRNGAAGPGPIGAMRADSVRTTCRAQWTRPRERAPSNSNVVSDAGDGLGGSSSLFARCGAIVAKGLSMIARSSGRG